MKRRLWTLLLVLSMVLALLPAGALAANGTALTESMTELTGGSYYLGSDVTIAQTITVSGTVTLDLNGHVLQMTGGSSVIKVTGSGQLTIQDTGSAQPHYFDVNESTGLWTLTDNTTENTVSGGIITGGAASKQTFHDGYMDRSYYLGGGVYMEEGGKLTMTGGSIVGCTSENFGGGVALLKNAAFTMSGGSILGCTSTTGVGGGIACYDSGNKIALSGNACILGCRAISGGGIWSSGTLSMEGGSIADCIAADGSGGGVHVVSGSSFAMSGSAEIQGCKAFSEDRFSANGGGVYVANGAKLTMSGRAKIENCHAENTADAYSAKSYGGGICAYNMEQLTLTGNVTIDGCTAENGGAMHLTGPNGKDWPGNGKFFANGGTVRGEVVLGELEDCPCTIQAEEGSAGTSFEGRVTVAAGSEIKAGQFKGEVINNGVISGGAFQEKVTNNSGGSISGGELETVINCEGGTVAEGAEVSALYFVVTLDNEGTMTTENVSKDGLLPLPQVSLRKNYRLDGWYYTGEDHAEGKWNFAADTVRAAMTLRAKWVVCDHSGSTARPTCTDGAACTECGETLPALKHDWSAWSSNGNDTHSRVCKRASAHTETEACSGGAAATCRDRSLCAVCGQPYGALDPDAHTDLTVIPAKAPTSGSAGNMEYWHCAGCGKYYKDAAATQEITAEDTVLPQLPGLVVGPAADTVRVAETENSSVTVDPKHPAKGSTVIITVEPDEGYALDEITVTDKDGNNLKLTDKGDGKYSFTMPSGKVDIDATFKKLVETSPFADVSTDAYYYEAVKWAAENNITGGIGNGLFGPDLTCTRGQIVTFLWRAAGSPEPTALSTFTDVAADAYYAKAVAWAVENGVTTGTGDGKFSPDAPCTRGQAVTFLWRALGQLTGDTASFSDVPADSYFAQAVAWAAANGVTTGVGNNLFAPGGDCTRAQIVTFLWRAYRQN